MIFLQTTRVVINVALVKNEWNEIFTECNIFAGDAGISATMEKKKKTLCKFSGELRDGAWGARGVPADGIRFKVLIKRFTRHGSKARTGNDNEIKLHVGHKGMQLQNEAPPRCRDARQKTHEHRENKIHTAVRRQTRKYPRNIFVTSEALTLILHRVVRFSRGTLAAFAINRVRRNIYKLPLNESNQISRPLT